MCDIENIAKTKSIYYIIYKTFSHEKTKKTQFIKDVITPNFEI